MSEQDDKAKKLKEIQDRLAEIKGKPTDAVKKLTPVKETKKDNPTPPPSKKKSPPLEEKKPIATEKTNTVNKPLSEKKPFTEKKSPEVPPKPVTKKVVDKKPESKLTQEEMNWRANKIKPEPALKPTSVKKKTEKKSGKNKLSLIYTAVSLVVTLSILGYFVNAYYFSDVNSERNKVTSKLPETIEETKEVANSQEFQSEEYSDESPEEITDEAVEEPIEKLEEVEETAVQEIVVVEPKKVKRQPISNNQLEAKLPNGIIISYASNSTRELAINNVQELKNKGYDANYYYMPDKNAGSPALYKVYVGPFNNESSALPVFKKIVGINDKAFILRLN